jgi:hypothetical protein
MSRCFFILAFLFTSFGLKAEDTLVVMNQCVVYVKNPSGGTSGQGILIADSLLKGDKVIKLFKQGKYYKILYGGDKKGFVSVCNIEPFENELVFLGSHFVLSKDTIRASKASYNYGSKVSDTIIVLKREGAYSYVKRRDNSKGWIRSDFLSYEGEIPENTPVVWLYKAFQGLNEFGNIHWTLGIITFICFWILLLVLPGVISYCIVYLGFGRIKFIPNWILKALLLVVMFLVFFGINDFFQGLPPYKDHGIWYTIAMVLWVIFTLKFCWTRINYGRCPKCHKINAGYLKGSKELSRVWNTKTTTTAYYKGNYKERESTNVDKTTSVTYDNQLVCCFCRHEWSVVETSKISGHVK